MVFYFFTVASRRPTFSFGFLWKKLQNERLSGLGAGFAAIFSAGLAFNSRAAEVEAALEGFFPPTLRFAGAAFLPGFRFRAPDEGVFVSKSTSFWEKYLLLPSLVPSFFLDA